MSTLNVAVVGSGPAGMYLVEALHKLLPRLAVDVIERLPTPFGLVRSGVAPDHASVRAIAQRFEQVLDRPGVRFAGGVELGRDIGLTQLRELYDVVVLAHGCPVDKALGIPGEHLPGVWGSARFTGWYNAHPDHAGSGATDLPRSVIVLGNGNVAIDVARLLTKSEIDLAATDMHPAAVQVLGRSNVQKVMLVGRRAPIDARFSVKELEELADVANVTVALPAGASLPTDAELDALPPAQGAMLRALRTHATNHSRHDRSANIEFQFLARPAEVLGATRQGLARPRRAGAAFNVGAAKGSHACPRRRHAGAQLLDPDGRARHPRAQHLPHAQRRARCAHLRGHHHSRGHAATRDGSRPRDHAVDRKPHPKFKPSA